MVFHVFPTQTLMPNIFSSWSDMDLLRVPLNPMDDHIYIYILMKWPWYPHGQTHVRCLCGRWRKLFLEKHRYGIQMHSECRLPWWVSLPGQGLGRILTLSSKCNKNLMTFEGMVSHVRRLRFLKPFWFYSGEQIPCCSDLSSLLPGRGRMCTRWNRCLGDWSGAPSIGSFWW